MKSIILAICLLTVTTVHSHEGEENKFVGEERSGRRSEQYRGFQHPLEDGGARSGVEETERDRVEETEHDGVDKRAGNCGLVSATKPVPNTHSACLSPSHQLEEEIKPSEADKKEIVDYHNQLRAGVSPKAANMLKMVWDDDLALTAQHWASHCETGHDTYEKRNIPGKYSVGQNMYTMPGRMLPWKEMIDGWYDEVKDYGYGRGSVNGKVIGHYTQVVAAATSKIGCGAAKCRTGGTFTVYTFCNYAPAGNSKLNDVNGAVIKDEVKYPYKESAKSCSDCQKCEGNLCVCKDTPTTTDICFNKGELNVNDCACDCTRSKYVGKQCETCIDMPGGARAMGMTCAKAKSRGYCKFTNIQDDCCKTCGG